MYLIKGQGEGTYTIPKVLLPANSIRSKMHMVTNAIYPVQKIFPSLNIPLIRYNQELTL